MKKCVFWFKTSIRNLPSKLTRRRS